jgi:hypothetical protein
MEALRATATAAKENQMLKIAIVKNDIGTDDPRQDF